MARFEDEGFYDDEEEEEEEEYEDEDVDYGNGPADDDYYDYEDRTMFADPGGNSALRAETPDNPRNLPCPTCDSPSRLTPEDVRLGYQCDSCADRAERGWDY